jgi:ribosomal protein S18 acetylase RimI-like enzyme
MAEGATLIRQANQQDVDALCDLYYEFHEFHVWGVPDRLRSLGARGGQDWTRLRQALDQIFQDENAAIFVAEASGEVVGLVEVYLRQDDETNPLIHAYRYGHVQSLVVQEAYRRSGIGKQLLEGAQHWASGKGATEVRLEVWEFEANPLKFYERAGYRTLKRTLIKGLR